MLITCKCMNILLKSDSNDDRNQLNHQSLRSKGQQLSLEEHSEEEYPVNINKLTGDHLQFFKIAKESNKIWLSTVQHVDLINVKLIENWNVHTCIHCKTITHAEANDSTKFLINPLLLTNQEKINIIKNNKNFSKAFNILLQDGNSTDIRQLNNLRNAVTDDPPTVRTKELRQYMNDVMEQERDATAKRIENYSKQQTALLRVFCEKVKQEFEEILCVINDVPAHQKQFDDGPNYDKTIIVSETGPNNSKHLLSSHLTPPVTPDSTPMSIGNSPNFRQQNSFIIADGARNSVLTRNMASSITYATPDKRQSNLNRDHDVFFEIDGLDTTSFGCNDLQNDYNSNDEDAGENDDLDSTFDSRNGITISSSSRQYTRIPRGCAAQSLPMAVPTFNQRNDKDYDEYPEDNVDIAASIKALAKSVHGEAIFGDLPRPRFSTQI